MDSMAIGYDDSTNLIWLLGGGISGRKSLISFNLSRWNDTICCFGDKLPVQSMVNDFLHILDI